MGSEAEYWREEGTWEKRAGRVPIFGSQNKIWKRDSEKWLSKRWRHAGPSVSLRNRKLEMEMGMAGSADLGFCRRGAALEEQHKARHKKLG